MNASDGSTSGISGASSPVNHYLLQVERFSRLLLGLQVSSWPIEDAANTLRTIEALFASARQDGWQTLPA
jgi:hypothetical protein